MKMKSIKLILLGAVALVGLNSCDIERLPYGSMSSDDITADPEGYLPTVMNGIYAQMKDWSDPMHRCGEYAGDNMMIRSSSTDAFFEFISYSRTPDNYRLQTFWDNSYKVIAQSSNVIDMIETGSDATVDQYIGEAYFLRGMMYFYLCRAYGRPYYDNPTTNLGVPIVNGTPDDLSNVVLPDRSPVADVYAQAIADLVKASSLMSENKGAAYASKGAADALLSRICLYMSGSWANPNTAYAQKAAEYAQQVISDGEYQLLPYESFKTYNELTPENNSESIFVAKCVASEYSGYDHYYGIGGMYSNIGGMGWGEMYASAKYIALLDETGRNDWYNDKIVDARAAFIEPQYTSTEQPVFRFIKNTYDSNGNQTSFNYLQLAYDLNTLKAREVVEIVEKDTTWTYYPLTEVDTEQGIYTITYAGEEYQGVTDQFINWNNAHPMFYIVKCSREGEESQLHSPIITRLGEVYLNMAEAKAKMGDLAGACTALNVIRERSLPGEGYSELTADNYIELIEKERQLELAYQAERSYDVYRNGLSMSRMYPGAHNSMEVIQPNDYRTIYFIPTDAINAYAPNILTQNPTSN